MPGRSHYEQDTNENALEIPSKPEENALEIPSKPEENALEIPSKLEAPQAFTFTTVHAIAVINVPL
jgi:hypothetical protein